jgi:hypothetical protein
LSLLLLGFGGYYLWEYYDYYRTREAAEQLGFVVDHAREQRQLWWGLAMLGFSLFGRPLVLAFMGGAVRTIPSPRVLAR